MSTRRMNMQATPAAEAPVPTTATAIIQAQKAFAQAIASVSDADNAAAKAKTDLDGANTTKTALRQRIICELVDAADKGDWTFAHAEAGVNAAVETWAKGLRINDPDAKRRAENTMGTFANECKNALKPEARSHVKRVFAEIAETWDDESAALAAAEDKSKVDAPLHKAFHAQYQAATGAINAYTHKKDWRKNAIAEGPVALARAIADDNQFDGNRVARLVKKVVADLRAIEADFPHEDLETVIDFLKNMDRDALVLARKKMLRALAKPAKRTITPKSAKGKGKPTYEEENAAADDFDEE